MNDPHVEALHYKIRHRDDVDYAEASALEYKADTFDVGIDAGKVTIKMREHFATEEAARAKVDPFLRAWEIAAALDGRPGELEFIFRSAQIVDRHRTAGHVLHAQAATVLVTGGEVHFRVIRAKWPAPPVELAVDATVELMFDRFRRYREGRTTISDAANFCLTALEAAAGGRDGAAQRFKIARLVLAKVGELSATKGGPEARKAAAAGVSYTNGERQWLDAAIVAMIRRAAAVAANNTERPAITMKDLPSL